MPALCSASQASEESRVPMTHHHVECVALLERA